MGLLEKVTLTTDLQESGGGESLVWAPDPLSASVRSCDLSWPMS